MKTLEDFKNEVALEYYPNAPILAWRYFMNNYPVIADGQAPDKLLTKAAERYASYMCEQQRIICADEAVLEPKGMLLQVDRESILSAPLATQINNV